MRRWLVLAVWVGSGMAAFSGGVLWLTAWYVGHDY